MELGRVSLTVALFAADSAVVCNISFGSIVVRAQAWLGRAGRSGSLNGSVLRWVLLGWFAGLASSLGAVESLRILPQTVSARVDGGFTFQFESVAGDGRAFSIQMAPALGTASAWATVAEAVARESAPGLFTVAVPGMRGVGAAFFRVVAQATLPPVRINEVMSDNAGAWVDSLGGAWDWIELHNPSETAVNLRGYGLTDELAKPDRWTFPEVMLQPGGFLVVWASGLDRLDGGAEWHAPFRLNADGDSVWLLAPDGRTVDRVTWETMAPDTSYGRAPGLEGAWVVYAPATISPGKANVAGHAGPPIAAPVYSVEALFHPADAEVLLALRADGTGRVVRYTTNGDPVSVRSAIYADPIRLRRTTVVRARTYLGDRFSEERVRTYFFGVTSTLPIVSLATASTNMEFRNGYLYGMGSSVLSASGQVLQNYPYSGSNAWKDREVEASFEFFETNGAMAVNQRLGLKIYGGWGSRGYPQKSLALFARQDYGEGELRHAFFPGQTLDRFESLVLRNSGNDNQSTHQTAPRPPITAFGPTTSYGSYFVHGTYTMLRDGLMQALLRDLDLDTQAYRPVVVYLNGEYWGLYNLREKINENYVLDHHGMKPGQVDVIEGYGSVMAGEAATYAAMRSFIAGRDLKNPANYAAVEERFLDVDNFIDYNLAVIYNQNFDIGNIKCWRPRATPGRFRWIVYDQDYGFGLWPAEVYEAAMRRDYADYDNMFKFATAGTGSGTGWPNEGGRTLLLRRMLLNDTFKARFVTRCADLLNGPFREERVLTTIDAMAAVIRPEMGRHLQRWSWPELVARGYGRPHQAERIPFAVETWESHLDVLRAFARTRPTKLRLDCSNHFALRAGLAQVTVGVEPQDAGRVQINTLNLAQFPWTGIYFRDYAVSLQAIPRPGYRFAGWQGAADLPPTARVTWTPPASTNHVTARFVPAVEAWPAQPVVSFSEIQYHPADSAVSGDWIELQNLGDQPVDVTGWLLRDEDDAREFLLPAGAVPARGYLVLCQQRDAFDRIHPGVPQRLGSFRFGLNNRGDQVRLYQPDGTPVAALRYADDAPWDAGADGTGRTLQRIDPTQFSPAASAWKASTAVGGSPGQENP